ncbi:ferrochelatase [Sphingobium jiangsuense]|uniref:Ferrochelatase n=1 Tax=Sphingobium jiangsuense TaxID=870476 RepID=A0A7W6BLF1_9SPHN|nr:ferrochelatase [Sphingobium jiangsuense]MBB3924788.1 ferrochelatase [Sphingobium jiangsuense]GLT02326.1 ferrochelatase [Sphingobium jiangsuense]
MSPAPSTSSPKIGVLIVNLGTPDAPEPGAVRRYLAEFLSDRRVVELPPLLWQPILRGVILTTRPKKSAHAYRQVWMDEGSPLAVYTSATAAALAERFAGEGVRVDWAMRYGNPSIADRVRAMLDAGVERLLFAPLYPQYCGATTATANDALFAVLAGLRAQPAVRTLPPYHDEPAYIEAIAATIRAGLATLDRAPDALLLSYHGMPERTRTLGDPYYEHCLATSRLLTEALRDIFAGPIETSFQSRFGRAKWLEPSTETRLAEMAARGLRRIAVATPGFSADCVETLEEIALRGEEFFRENGGEKLHYFPCLNAGAEATNLYERMIRRELSGWLPPPSLD